MAGAGAIRSGRRRGAAGLAVVLLVLAGAASRAPVAPGMAAKPRVIHVDCGAPAGGDGSRARPLSSLEQAGRAQLRPGAKLLLRRGMTCTGTLEPRGSGRAGRRIVIEPYGRGPRPLIEGTGEQALLLRDISHVVVRKLEVTNPGDGSEPKRGVTVVAERGVVRDVTVRRLYVHDVGGDLSKGGHGSGAIQAAVWGDPVEPIQRFDRLLIARNRIEEVSRSGIRIDGTLDRSRPSADEPWPEASSRVIIRRNRLDQLAGDGIVPTGTLGARVAGNVVANGNLAGRSYADPKGFICNAGIWTFNANRTRIVRNEVYGMRFNGCDGTGYDIDYNQDGTIVQFNYSHDNEGGFILLCGEEQIRRADVRFNLSIDDAHTLNEAPCRVAEGVVGTLSGIRFYNNTIVAPEPGASGEQVPLPALVGAGTFEFRNNIVVATEPGTAPFPCGEHCSHNLFFNLPAAGEDAIVADPSFQDPSRRGRGRLAVGAAFRLRAGSPAIGAGTTIAGAPRRDYFGNPIPAATAPAIGMHQPG